MVAAAQPAASAAFQSGAGWQSGDGIARTTQTDPCPSSPQLRYANNSNYKNDTMIRKECHVSQAVLDELRRIIQDSEASSGFGEDTPVLLDLCCAIGA